MKAKLRAKWTKQFGGGDAINAVHPHLDDRLLLPQVLNFTAAYPAFSRRLFDLHGEVKPLGSRLGRGEILLYYLFDDVELGGVSTTVDVFIDGQPKLEVKCARREGERYLHFMLGIDEVPASLKFFYRVLQLYYEAEAGPFHLKLPSNFANISKAKLNEVALAKPINFGKALNTYKDDLLSGPVGQKTYLFFDQATALPVFYGKLTRENLQLERISGGLTRLSLNP